MTRRETVLAALAELLADADLPVTRNDVLPARIGAEGALVLHDGEPGEPEITLSPATWHYQHRAELDLFVSAADREEAFDELVAAVGQALAADRTLGGRCDWVEPEAPRPQELADDGAEPVRAATIVIVLHYSTTDPLG